MPKSIKELKSKMPSYTLRDILSDKEKDLASLLVSISDACKYVSDLVKTSALDGNQGTSGSINIQGEVQQTLDIKANDTFVRICSRHPKLAAIVSEEVEEVLWLKEPEKGDFILYIDPLDGSSNLDVDLSVGSIFSVVKVGADPSKNVLRAGKKQIAAGYALYGPSTVFIFSTGRDVQGFTIDTKSGDFLLSHPFMTIPNETHEFAINCSRSRFWLPPVSRYVEECAEGKSGPRGKDFNMRWTASMVADVHRILIRGGVFLYPKDTSTAVSGGKLRLLYEANPMAFIVAAAGGKASTGTEDILSVQPTCPHQRTSVILGSSDEVSLIETYHAS